MTLLVASIVRVRSSLAGSGLRFAAYVIGAVLVCTALFAPSSAGASFESGVSRLALSDADVGAVAEELAQTDDERALAVLEALLADQLVIDAAGKVLVRRDGAVLSALDGKPVSAAGTLRRPLVDNRARRRLLPALARMRLTAKDPKVRLTAAEELAKRPDASLRALIEAAHRRESSSDIRDQLAVALARIDLGGQDASKRLAALEVLGDLGDVSLESQLKSLAESKAPPEDAAVKAAAGRALASIRNRAAVYAAVGNLFYGLSLGSVLLLAALGLAITFGLMRVINMAHGEMLMIGAYATYVVQNLFKVHLPQYQDAYLLFALPVAFASCVLVGVVLERTVIRFLYGRPLETLLATAGISLVLIQIIRLTFGASNVTVANPTYLSGGFALFPGVVLPYSRLAVIAFVAIVVALVAFLLGKTPLGLQVRAITQNREMAANMGIRTASVDMWTFGFGCGVAGLGGVALSQLGNVGPELGQAYIVDSFMVVVLGGVGNIFGTIAGAVGLGVVNKLLEPFAGAVLGKIIILGFIVLFIQKRPQGLFALKGRAVEA